MTKVVIEIPDDVMELHARDIDELLDDFNVQLGEINERIEMKEVD